MNDTEMRKEYNFENSVANPYSKTKKAITIRLEPQAIKYFKELALELGLPYQTLINMFLNQCASEQKRPTLVWQSTAT